MRHPLLIALWLLAGICTDLHAQFTSLSGRLPSRSAGQEVRIYRARDYLSWDPLLLDSAQSDPNGNFLLEFKLVMPSKVLMTIPELQILYLEPGKNYEIIPGVAGGLPAVTQPGECLHNQILALHRQSDSIRGTAGPEEETDWRSVYSAISGLIRDSQKIREPFLRNYAYYHLGYLLIEAGSRLHDMRLVDSLESAWLSGPVLYEHPEYLEFLRLMTLNRMTVTAFRHYCREPEVDCGLPMDILIKEAAWYPHPEIRELIILMGYKLCFQNNWLGPDRPIWEGQLLNQINASANLYLKVMGANLLNRYVGKGKVAGK